MGKRASVAALRGMIADIERCVIACIKTAHHRSRFILPAAMQQNAPGQARGVDVACVLVAVLDQHGVAQLLGRAAGCGDLPGQLAAGLVIALAAEVRFFPARDAGDSLQICADKQFFHGASSFC